MKNPEHIFSFHLGNISDKLFDSLNLVFKAIKV